MPRIRVSWPTSPAVVSPSGALRSGTIPTCQESSSKQSSRVEDQYEPLAAPDDRGEGPRPRNRCGGSLDDVPADSQHGGRLVDRERQGPLRDPHHQQAVVDVQALARQTEESAQVDDGDHLALEVDEAEHLRRRFGNRRDGDHAEDALDALQRQGIGLPAEPEGNERTVACAVGRGGRRDITIRGPLHRNRSSGYVRRPGTGRVDGAHGGAPVGAGPRGISEGVLSAGS